MDDETVDAAHTRGPHTTNRTAQTAEGVCATAGEGPGPSPE
jgi:hypothetical protein